MLVKKHLLTPLIAAGLASADSARKSITFELLTLSPGNDIHFSGFQAATSSIVLKSAVCQAEPDNLATFSFADGDLFLYQTPKILKQLYVDSSVAGQGKLKYISSSQTSQGLSGRKASDRKGSDHKASDHKASDRKPWKIDSSDNLTYKGAGLIACPSSTGDGSWTVWVDVGISQPGNGEGCVELTARTILKLAAKRPATKTTKKATTTTAKRTSNVPPPTSTSPDDDDDGDDDNDDDSA
ncbi:hypothetical protein QQZ08_001465 [Neonectria magnoliae]|uniref:Cell wall protein PhiA n=1 Tax=Neonectria magnoliae TaxID=2732573 RepID=A0ABR1IDZ0_9HYPO